MLLLSMLLHCFIYITVYISCSVRSEDILYCDKPLELHITDESEVDQNCTSIYMFRNSSQEFTCPNIQAALEFSKNFSSNCSMIIHLPPGEQIINDPVSITSSMRIIGNKIKSLIRCDYNRSDLPNDTLHTIYFNKSLNVTMNNFVMYNCALPLRFDTSRKVEIVNINLR